MGSLVWKGTLSHFPKKVISFFKAQRMVQRGYLTYLTYVRDIVVVVVVKMWVIVFVGRFWGGIWNGIISSHT